jgi:hypothetical protein
MSPPNWGIVPFSIEISVYPDVRVALKALMQATTTIQAQRLEEGTANLLTNHLLFRGHSDVTQRVLPTRLRGPRRSPAARQRHSVMDPPKVRFNGIELPSSAFDAGGNDPRDHWGDWFEKLRMPSIDDSLADVREDELQHRDAHERDEIKRASRIPEVAQLDDFRKRAAVRHYSRVVSSLLDVSTHPEVAAFFATGGASKPPASGGIGVLWAIDVNFLAELFSVKTTTIPGGERTTLIEERDSWGDNKKMFEEFGVLPTRLEFDSVQLPFQRPQAQHARFLSLAGENGQALPGKTEFTWWSIVERRSCACAFVHDGRTYENPDHNITASALWPEHEPIATALAAT